MPLTKADYDVLPPNPTPLADGDRPALQDILLTHALARRQQWIDANAIPEADRDPHTARIAKLGFN